MTGLELRSGPGGPWSWATLHFAQSLLGSRWVRPTAGLGKVGGPWSQAQARPLSSGGPRVQWDGGARPSGSLTTHMCLTWGRVRGGDGNHTIDRNRVAPRVTTSEFEGWWGKCEDAVVFSGLV